MTELPRLILHNSVSIDGSLTGFEPSLELHYRLAGSFFAGAHLVGSNTVRSGIELFGNGFPAETPADFRKPAGRDQLPLWVVPDTRGSLLGLLHACRQSGYCRDVVVMVSESTPASYFDYLEERGYDHYLAGTNRVNLRFTLELLLRRYGIETVLADTGSILGNLLLNQRLVTDISLLIHPVVVGPGAYHIFPFMDHSVELKLVKQQRITRQYSWVVYRVVGESISP